MTTNIDFEYITIQRTPCNGPCPVYKARINNSGLVEWYGDLFVEKIGEYKKDNNITILQSARWDEIVRRVMIKGKSKGLSEELIDTIFKAIHQESINHQMRIMNNGVDIKPENK